jgi:hypothetical protein
MDPQVELEFSKEPLTYFYPEPDEFTTFKPISLGFILTLSSHQCLGLPSGLLLSGFHFHPKILYAPLLSPIRVTRPANLTLHDLTTRIKFGENRP